MKQGEIRYNPVEGKTYSLFGGFSTTFEYYQTVRSLADKVLIGNDIEILLETLRKYSSRKRYLKQIVSGYKSNSLISFCLNTVHDTLKPYTKNTAGHLKTLSPFKLWDRRLATTEEQYHLYMLEIELTNRRNRNLFLEADRKISLQPYCLKDFSVSCKAKSNGYDYQCKACSKKCFQNLASCIIKENNIESYIWMGASISKAAKEAYRNNKRFGILGIACIPELVHGMRRCIKYRIPVIGIPLSANRCVRWFGEFHPNSVDLNELEDLLKKQDYKL
jgi:hypothetical protein